LDLASLIQAGVFAARPGTLWTAAWTRADLAVASLGVCLRGTIPALWSLELRYVIEDQAMCTAITLTGVSKSSAPRRWRLRCPQGRCFQPVTALYLPPGASTFGCEQCHGLNPRRSRTPERHPFFAACADVLAAEARLAAAQHPADVGPAAEALARARHHLVPLVQHQLDQHRRVGTARRRAERILAAGQGASVGQLCRTLRTLWKCQRDEMACLRAAADEVERVWAPILLTVSRQPVAAEAPASDRSSGERPPA
jgi:hypothetical protein